MHNAIRRHRLELKANVPSLGRLPWARADGALADRRSVVAAVM
jgi:hypothetical protein